MTDETLAAEVVLRGPAGAADVPITSANLDRYRPDPERASAARRWFAQLGFTTGDLHGTSFTISGPRALFDRTFGTRLGAEGQVPGADVLVLPPLELPEQLRSVVECVTFSPPPDFGPPAY
jgi:hypothetical protein